MTDGTVVVANEAAQGVAALLAAELRAATGWQVTCIGIDEPALGGAARLRLLADLPGGPSTASAADAGATGTAFRRAFPSPVEEGYRLRVSAEGVDIEAPSAAGAFYGTRSLLQLLPPDFLRSAPSRRWDRVELDGISIEDAPRFGWRGMALDVSRHFFPKDFLLKLLDLASFHKLNVLHLHLTDDQGWRVQVDRYPKLTEIGAWRRESPAGHESDGRKDGTPHGGFYTKADLAEIVAHAARRFVTVVPEIDMPGHMQAAIAAYPELGNTAQHLEVYTNWGISEHVLNMNDGTVRFCREVLEEVMDLFPGPFVHIGGDECPTTEWEASADARRRADELGLAGPRQLQGWFTAQVAETVTAAGKSLIGWEEVLGAGAPPGAVIAVWRAEHALGAAVEAAETSHRVIMAPEPWTYFDWAYADDPREPLAIRPAISTDKAYSFEPVPEGLRQDLEGSILGAQCQLWTEYVSTPQHAEYMYFPRACALAEVTWSGRRRDWPDFERRLRDHTARLGALGVNYRPLEGPTPGQARTWLSTSAAPPVTVPRQAAGQDLH
ncbi:MAG TPA: beta-N-acetylhexosaminidase [Acidimicrobiales bacterium]|nr:beta-N-acetylhexosaminidase [Acidimicrobiales bacterium]